MPSASEIAKEIKSLTGLNAAVRVIGDEIVVEIGEVTKTKYDAISSIVGKYGALRISYTLAEVFTGDGITKTFNAGYVPSAVFKDGIMQYAPDDYRLREDGAVVFNTAPASGSTIKLRR